MSRPRSNRGKLLAKVDTGQVRHEIARLYLQLFTQAEIARQVNLNQSNVSRHLAAIQEEWRAARVRDLDLAKSRELARIDEVERAAWEQWKRSIKDAVERVTEQVEGPAGADGKPTGARLKALERIAGRCGDPRYLSVIDNCVDRRCKILGLYAPAKVAPTDPDGGPLSMSDQERTLRLMALYQLAKERAQSAGAKVDDGTGDEPA